MIPRLKESERPWARLSRAERGQRFADILMDLGVREILEPAPRTTGEFWKSSSYLKKAAIFAFMVTEGKPAESE